MNTQPRTRLSIAITLACLLFAGTAFAERPLSILVASPVPSASPAPYNSPYDVPALWAYHLDSATLPIVIFYSSPADAATARATLAKLEIAWNESTQLGFRVPVPYDPWHQGRFNVFLGHGTDDYVEAADAPVQVEDQSTRWPSYVVLDPWGEYGHRQLSSTAIHEFHHAVQAAYNWQQKGSLYEASANYIQELFAPGQNADALAEIADFQKHPEWSPAYDDSYKTYYMYGAWLYFKFLEQRYFKGQPDFMVRLWEGLSTQLTASAGKSTPPTWIDAVQGLLPAGTTFADSVAQFARWRTFSDPEAKTQAQAISKNNVQNHALPAPPAIYKLRVLKSIRGVSSKGVPVYATHYIELLPDTDCQSVDIHLDAPGDARWSMQHVMEPQGRILVILTALPASGAANADPFSQEKHGYSLTAVCE